MLRQPSRITVFALVLAVFLGGCAGTDEALRYFGQRDLQYYKEVAQQIEYPAVDSGNPPEVTTTQPPRTLAERRKDKPRKLTLMQALQIALANNRILRSNAQFLSPANTLLTSGETTPSVYDPAIQETGILFGRRGVEAALADFDTTFSTSAIWGRSEDVQNNLFFAGGLPGATLQQDSTAFRSAFTKRFADSGSITVGHDWNYNYSNAAGQLFPSTYTGNLRAEYRRPLWAASGTEFTRIAGPVNPNFGAITGVSQGVVIARINNDISLADFQLAVRNLVKDVEDVYWDLYLKYHQYHTAVVARESALKTWEDAKNLDELGLGRKENEPQARDQYYAAKAAAESALSDLYSTEIRLRRLLGLPVNDGTILQPADQPAMGKLIPDWRMSLTQALTQRVELRKQKWNIKSLELQLKAAKSLTNPRLDFTSSYQVNGFGDRLFGENDNDSVGTPQGLRSAYETLTQGNQTSWTLGFEFSMPIGFRSARAQVRNLELRLLKARQVLAAQEQEISHELATAFQNLALHYANMKSNYERIPAARELTRVREEQFKKGLTTADFVLRAQLNQAQAETAFYTSVARYNQALAELELRKGTLLQYNSIFLAESEWTPEAYRQALRRAWDRTYGFDQYKLLHTEPPEFVPQMPQMEIPWHQPDEPSSSPPGNAGSQDSALPTPAEKPAGASAKKGAAPYPVSPAPPASGRGPDSGKTPPE